MDIWALSDLSTPWCLHVAVTLKIPAHISKGHTEIEALAAAAQADPAFLLRVLRHLTAQGIFEEPTPRTFALNQAALQLQDPGIRLGLDLDGFGGRMAHAWGTLLTAVRTGQPAYHEAFGRTFWDDLDAHPKLADAFDDLMGPGHGTPDPEVLLNPAAWENIHTVVDVGGGTGALLAEVLKAHPGLTGILVDTPRAVAKSPAVFESAGVTERATVYAQSFFDPLPAGAGLYLLKNVLSDWPDAEATQILRRCAEAAFPSGRLVVLGGVTNEAKANPELLMMVLLGGKGRTLEEFTALAQTAGLQVQNASRQKSGRFLLECVPTSPPPPAPSSL